MKYECLPWGEWEVGWGEGSAQGRGSCEPDSVLS